MGGAAMQVKRTVAEADYARTLAEIRSLIEAEPDRGSPNGDRLDALVSLVESYEADRCEEAAADIENR